MIVREKNSFSSTIIAGLVIILAILLFYNISVLKEQVNLSAGKGMLESFTTIFLSILLEALPFIMLGAFISSVIQIFVSEQAIAKIIPKNKFAGLIMASLIGFVFPVCECAVVPIMRRLVRKGVPLGIAVTFMASVPIINPVVMASTYYAFADRPYMVLLRGGLGFAGAILIGYLIDIFQGKDTSLKNVHAHSDHDCGCAHHGHIHGHSHHHHHNTESTYISKIMGVIEHTSTELYDVGKMLIIGAILSSVMQTFISREFILSVGQGTVSSTLVMMTLAFVLSLCSEADAFIARTFIGQFTTGSIIGFLILGPMIDIKNTIMLGSSFKFGFIARLIALTFSICFILSSLVNLMAL